MLNSVLKEAERGYPDQGHRIWEVWESVVGPELARRASPLVFKNGKLTLAVEGSAWAQQINLLKTEITGALNDRLGCLLVTALKTTQATVERPPEKEDPTPVLRDGPLSESESDLVEQTAAVVSDPELAEAFRKARATALKRIKPPRSQEE